MCVFSHGKNWKLHQIPMGENSSIRYIVGIRRCIVFIPIAILPGIGRGKPAATGAANIIFMIHIS